MYSYGHEFYIILIVLIYLVGVNRYLARPLICIHIFRITVPVVGASELRSRASLELLID